MTAPASIAAVLVVAIATGLLGLRGVRVARTPADFLVAARQVPPVLNASAISGEYLSAASFLGIAGLAMAEGLGALWYAVGYAAGYLVLLAVVAAPLRRFGAYTVPEFVEGRLDAPRLRRLATAAVIVISGFYLLPQLRGAGITLQDSFGAPYWAGVLIVGVVVTIAIASGGMRGITIVQAFLFWLKLLALAFPALVLLAFVRHPPLDDVVRQTAPTFPRPTTVHVPQSVTFDVTHAVPVSASGVVDGSAVKGSYLLEPGRHRVEGGSTLVFPAHALAPHVEGLHPLTGAQWASPLVRLNGTLTHPLAATYGVIIATFLGALGLPHILVRFYTNPDGHSARRTTAVVVLFVSTFYLLPGLFALLGRLNAPGLYVTGQTDADVLVLPRVQAMGATGALLAAVTAAGAVAAFLSTSSGLLIAMAGAISHDIMGRGSRAFRSAALGSGFAVTAGALAVAGFSINVLVGWAFAIAASSFGPLLVLGIWWRGLTRIGATVGLLVGGGAATAAVIASMAGVGRTGWPAVLLAEPAVWTVPLAFAVIVVVSRLTRWTLPADVTGKLLALHIPEEIRSLERRKTRV
ncbi:MAG: cation acetate symporter [Acidothermus sp.]|nr:cation acetate symporter [Acidothermus sp.]